jgi:hypothetical protein
MDWIRYLIPILALAIPCIAIYMTHWRKVKMKELEILERSGASLDADAQSRLARLEERVRVLEKIATDQPLALAKEIDRLTER